MTREKWLKIVDGKVNNYLSKTSYIFTPETWPQYKKALLEYIETIDEATEVYNMENGVKDGN